MSSLRRSLYYAGWVIVAFILLYFGDILIDYYKDNTSRTYDLSGTVWIGTIVPFIYGIHLGFLDGLPKKIKINVPLFLFVFLPSFILLVYPVTTLYVDIVSERLSTFATIHYSNVVYGIVSGMTLIKSITKR